LRRCSHEVKLAVQAANWVTPSTNEPNKSQYLGDMLRSS
jgi:hypothetical protein